MKDLLKKLASLKCVVLASQQTVNDDKAAAETLESAAECLLSIKLSP